MRNVCHIGVITTTRAGVIEVCPRTSAPVGSVVVSPGAAHPGSSRLRAERTDCRHATAPASPASPWTRRSRSVLQRNELRCAGRSARSGPNWRAAGSPRCCWSISSCHAAHGNSAWSASPNSATRQVSSGGPPPQVLRDPGQPLKTYSSGLGSSGLGSSGLGRNFPTIACCASSRAFFWAVHCRSTRSVNAFRWCSICSLIALR